MAWAELAWPGLGWAGLEQGWSGLTFAQRMMQRKQTIASWLTFWDVLGRFGYVLGFGDVLGRFGMGWGLGWAGLGWAGLCQN